MIDTPNLDDDKRLVDEHAIILLEEMSTNLSRLSNLKERWSSRAKEGLLPDPSCIGVFDMIKNMLQEHVDKLTAFFPTENATKKFVQIPTRSFEEVIELTDSLEGIHRALEIVERSYWQRLGGYYPPSVDAMIRGGAVSESGSIHQVFNAADIVCDSFWQNIFRNPRDYPWRGLTVFGRFHEFMQWDKFILAPEYVKARSTPTWIYFSHEVAHQAVPKLMQSPKFARIYQNLVRIFSRFPALYAWHSSAAYLANETIADILATLVGGDQYILALVNLKYYPSITIFSRQRLAGRIIRYPVLLRALLCSWTICLAWGLKGFIETKSGKVPESRFLLQAINRVEKEEAFSRKRLEPFFEKTDEELGRLVFWQYSPQKLRKYFSTISAHLDELNKKVIPGVVEQILKDEIPQRIKTFVKQDFYHTDPSTYYCNLDVHEFPSQTVVPSEALCRKTSDSDKIATLKRNKNKLLKGTMRDLQKHHLINHEPRDILASLNRLILKTDESGDKWSHIALCSIFPRGQHNIPLE